jgi:hypothetical protein
MSLTINLDNYPKSFHESIMIFSQQFPDINYSDLILNDIQTTDLNVRYTNYNNFKKYIYIGEKKIWLEYCCYC